MGPKPGRLLHALLQFLMPADCKLMPANPLPSLCPSDAIKREIHQLALKWSNQTIDDSSLAGGYLLIWQTTRHGKRFASRQSRNQRFPSVEEVLYHLSVLTGSCLRDWIREFIGTYQHKQVSRDALMALTRWLSGDERIRLQTHIPSAREVLDLQCEGLRPASVLLTFPRALMPVLNKPDGLAFLIHDLEHAAKFHQDARSHQLQVGFFRMIRKSLDLGIFEEPLQDPEFVKSFDYLISDMNTHPIHSLRYLHAVLVEHHLRSEKKRAHQSLSTGRRIEIGQLFHRLSNAWNLKGKGHDALVHIGQGELTEGGARDLEDWFGQDGALTSL